MTYNLPPEFLERMEKMLGEEYPAFLASYGEDRIGGLRINGLKADEKTLDRLASWKLSPVPWCPSGYYYQEGRPGLHPWHEAGLYYIQEPSAMIVGELAACRPGERVLDLCAAPGGKTTHLASMMKGEGLLVANEIHPARAKILSQNVERMGISNAVVTNETPERLAGRFPEFFDRIVVDAPCSGEGMFRKNPEAVSQWSEENVSLCAARQREILREADRMVAPGGRLVYSTCTFAPKEDEETVAWFLEEYPDYQAEEGPSFLDGGVPAWGGGNPEMKKTVRLWPHRISGEGHYAAVLRKGGVPPKKEEPWPVKSGGKKASAQKELEEFLCGTLTKEEQERLCGGRLISFGEQLYRVPKEMPAMDQLKVLRPGLHLGTQKKNRFEPSHALALYLTADKALRFVSYPADSEEIKAYLRGETLEAQVENGWCLVCVDGYSLGWAKASGGVLKNHYPKGLRR